MTNIAFIPVRGGSKSIPLKNIKNICGMPLVYWVLKASVESNFIDKIIVATEDEKIKSTVLNFAFPKVEIFDRNPLNAMDESPTIDVVNEFISKYPIKDDDNFFLIQATSPLLKSKDIDEMYTKYIKGNFNSMLTCVRFKRFLWTDEGTPLNYDYNKRQRRQDFKGCLMENGACWLTNIKSIKTSGNFLSGKIGIYEMPEYTSVEIDSEDDWFLVEKLLKKYL